MIQHQNGYIGNVRRFYAEIIRCSAHGFNTDHGFLQVLSAVCDDLRTAGKGVFSHQIDRGTGNVGGRGDRQRVSAYFQIYIAIRTGHIVIRQDVVAVRKGKGIGAINKLQLVLRRRGSQRVGEAGQGVICDHSRRDLIVDSLGFRIGPVVTDIVDNFVVRDIVGGVVLRTPTTNSHTIICAAVYWLP